MAPRKPPPLNLTRPIPPNTVLDFGSPILDFPDSPLQLSSPDSPLLAQPELDSSTASSSSDATSDDISKDLAVLEKLRKSVQKNLRLRPIKSSSCLPKITSQQQPVVSSSPWRDLVSPVSSTGSVYYTPVDNIVSPPFSARFVGRSDSDPSPAIQYQPQPRALDPALLYDLLSASHRPLLIDTRPPASYIAARIRHSINIAIPSLILKRYRKPGSGGFQSLDALRQFITSEDGKQSWDDLVQPGRNTIWNGSVVVYDDEMNEKDKGSPQIAAWALIPLITPLIPNGTVDYLKQGFSAARVHSRLRTHIVSDDPPEDNYQLGNLLPPPSARKGLFQLDTQVAAHSKILPELDRPPTAHSPMPMMPAAMSSSDHVAFDSTPSPPPSQLAFRRPPPPRKPSTTNLRRIDTRSAERLNTTLPKLHIHTPPVRAATLGAPTLQIPTNSSLQPHSPSHLNLRYSNHSPPGSATRYVAPPLPSPGPTNGGQFEFLSPHSSRPQTPRSPSTPMPIPSPSTARPDLDAPPTTEEAFPAFTISAILPNFLYLGPELTAPEHVEELKVLGVKRIINIAAECDDDHGLKLRENFERYFHIPMRDIVEEENITRGVREACDIIDDARLHSAPTYVHCKAGKSRSVTAVIAYLIHANHWTLSRAYSFVLERRKGISPNIGFVSELMTFEEQELGGKSVGVVQLQPSPGAHRYPSHDSDSPHDGGGGGDHHHHDPHGGYGPSGPSGRRLAHLRESLPPAFTTQTSLEGVPGPMSAGPPSSARVGDSGQEMEIKDATGRYRHARRAPVDEQTLQPMRRVSKAGLESAVS